MKNCSNATLAEENEDGRRGHHRDNHRKARGRKARPSTGIATGVSPTQKAATRI